MHRQSTNTELGIARVDAIQEKESALEAKKASLVEKKKTEGLLADANEKIKQLETELRSASKRGQGVVLIWFLRKKTWFLSERGVILVCLIYYRLVFTGIRGWMQSCR